MGTSTHRRTVRIPTPPTKDSVPVSPVDTEDGLLDRALCYGLPTQILRGILSLVYILGSCVCIHAAQLAGAPLYFFDRENYYAFMAVTKQYFALLIITTTQWWSPTLIRISGDASVKGQLEQTHDGHFVADFPERLVLIANHQLYTDWLYLWWIAYAARMHGHLYIILKQSLKWIPIIGPGMQFFSFIFLARKWSSDQQRMSYRLQKLRTKKHVGETAYFDPMWLVIFPEGTNLCANTRSKSANWAAKSGIDDCKHMLLPRHTGLQFCISELSDTLEYIYDCTIAYEHIPPGQYGEDIFTLRSICLEGRPPKSVNMHWRRFKVADIPHRDSEAMDGWIQARWREKDALMDYHLRHGKFPADETASSEHGVRSEGGYIETYVKPRNRLEFLQMYVPLGLIILLVGIVVKGASIIGKATSASRIS